MGFLDLIDVPERRTDRRLCTVCEATPASCRSREWLTTLRCCEECAGNHDRKDDR